MVLLDLFHNQGRGRPIGGGQSYADKVLSYSPIAYWKMNEAAGTDAICSVNTDQNGTYTGVTLGQTGIGDGETCPLFDGANDYCDIYSAALNTAWDQNECSVSIWAQVTDADIWEGALFRRILRVYVDSMNFCQIYTRSNSPANTIRLECEGNNTAKQIDAEVGPSVAWVHYGLTNSRVADEFIAYIDGSQSGATQTGLGNWSGNLDSNLCLIGAQNKTPDHPWKGHIAHPALFDTILTPAEMLSMATV